jgi:hypothetical protein
MNVKISTNQITCEEAHHENGTGHWGVKLGPDEIIAWECPMLGDGGAASDNQNALAWILSCYCDTDALDPSDGPDEILYVQGDTYYITTITVE